MEAFNIACDDAYGEPTQASGRRGTRSRHISGDDVPITAVIPLRQRFRQTVAPSTLNHYSPPRSERSAARLAHQSGGLGVPSSNLGAPTKNLLINQST
jgi:hypothetical protein